MHFSASWMHISASYYLYGMVCMYDMFGSNCGSCTMDSLFPILSSILGTCFMSFFSRNPSGAWTTCSTSSWLLVVLREFSQERWKFSSAHRDVGKRWNTRRRPLKHVAIKDENFYLSGCCNAPWLVCPSYPNIYIIRETVLHRFFNDHFECHFIRFCLLVYGMVWCHFNGLSSELVEGWTKKSVGMNGPPAEKCGITAETCSNTVWKLCGSSIPTPLKYVGHAGTHCCGWHVIFLLYI